jgi:NAD(P)H-hydrate epimerase
LLSEIENWWKLLPAGTILTPHPGEMAHLTGLEREAIQGDRVGMAAKYAAKWKCIVVLKGAYTVVSAPNKRVTIQPFANAALAKGGTGDVLAGAIAGLLAQGMAPYDAAIAGAYLHGLAGQLAAQAANSPRSIVAGDVADALGMAFHQLEGVNAL